MAFVVGACLLSPAVLPPLHAQVPGQQGNEFGRQFEGFLLAYYAGQWAQAEAMIQRCAELDPASPRLPFEHARIWLAQGKLTEALDRLGVAADRGFDGLHSLTLREDYAGIRSHPAYPALRQRYELIHQGALEQFRDTALAQRADLDEAQEVFRRSPILWEDGHGGFCQFLEFSPDGDRLVSVGNDRTVRLWDARTGEPLALLGLHSEVGVSATFSGDGRRILVVDRVAARASVWDGVAGDRRFQIDDHFVRAAALAADGRVFTMDETGVIRVLRLADGRVLARWDTGIPPRSQLVTTPGANGPDDFGVSSDSQRLLYLGADRYAHEHHAGTGAMLRRLGPDPVAANHALFCPDDRVCVVSDDGFLRFWDADPTVAPLEIMGSGSLVGRGAPSDGQRVFAMDRTRNLTLWDAQSGALVAMPLPGEVRALCAGVGPNGERILAAARQGAVDLISAQDGRVLRNPDESSTLATTTHVIQIAGSADGRFALGTLEGIFLVSAAAPMVSLASHSLPLTGFDLGPDEKVAVGLSTRARIMPRDPPWSARDRPEEPGVRLWSLADGALLPQWYSPGVSTADVRYDADGRLLIGSSRVGAGGILRLLADGSRDWGHSAVAERIRLGPAGRALATARTDFQASAGACLYWDGALVKTIGDIVRSVNPKDLVPAVLSHDFMATAHPDSTIRLWESWSGAPVETLSGHTGQIHHLETNRDDWSGDWLLSTSADKTARLWDLGDLEAEPFVLTGHEAAVWHGAFSPDGLFVATGDQAGGAILWNRDGELVHVLRGPSGAKAHSRLVRFLAFSPPSARTGESELLLTCSHDGTARLWEVETGELRATLSGHSGQVVEGRFTADGTRVLTRSADTSMRIWDVTDRRSSGDRLVATRVEYQEGGWLTFLPSGHYVAGGRAEEWARVRDRHGRLTPLSSYRELLRDPDLVREAMRGEVVPAPMALPSAPQVRLTMKSDEVTTTSIAVEGMIEDDYGIDAIEVSVEGRILPAAQVGSAFEVGAQRTELSLPVTLTGEELLAPVRVRVRNQEGIWSTWARHTVHYAPPRSSLYLVAIGVQDYQDEGLRLRSPRNDVAAVVAAFRAQAGTLYHEVHVTTLTDEEVSREALDRLLEQTLWKAGERDTLVVFVAGHGVQTEGGTYYLLTPDATPQDPYPGIRRDDLDRLVDWEGLRPTKRLLILDTCQAGTTVEGGARGFQSLESAFDQEEVDRRVEGQGIYIVAGSTDSGAARETPTQGVFTAALLAGLRGEADRKGGPHGTGDGDGTVDVKELIDFASDWVDDQGSAQRVTIPRIEGGDPFPLARVR